MLRRAAHRLAQRVGGPGRTRLAGVALVALLLGGVTALANTVDGLPYLLFPPLAAATYSLFTRNDPWGFPWDVPVALTVGAASGWLAILVVSTVYHIPQGPFTVSPYVVVLTVLVAGVVLHALSIELPPAFAVGLLLPFAGVPPAVYTVNVALASTLVAAAYVAWQRWKWRKI